MKNELKPETLNLPEAEVESVIEEVFKKIKGMVILRADADKYFSHLQISVRCNSVKKVSDVYIFWH
jgi:hypothetical protein